MISHVNFADEADALVKSEHWLWECKLLTIVDFCRPTVASTQMAAR